MKFIKLALSLAMIGVAFVSRADVTFDFTYSDGVNAAYGDFIATDEGGGIYNVTSGAYTGTSGTLSGNTYTLVANPNYPSPSYSSFFQYDSQLTPSADPKLSIYGLVFSLGSSELNLSASGLGAGSYYLGVEKSGDFSATTLNNGSATFSLTAVPEPINQAMIILGSVALLVSIGRWGFMRLKSSACTVSA